MPKEKSSTKNYSKFRPKNTQESPLGFNAPFSPTETENRTKNCRSETTSSFRESRATWDQAFVSAKTVNACQKMQCLMSPRTPNDFHWAPYHVLVSWFLGLFLGVGDQEQKKHSNIFLGLPMTISQMDVGLSSNLPGEKSSSKWMFHKFGGKFP